LEDLDANVDGRVSWGEYMQSLSDQVLDEPITEFS
jgi:hypothetical protein